MKGLKDDQEHEICIDFIPGQNNGSPERQGLAKEIFEHNLKLAPIAGMKEFGVYVLKVDRKKKKILSAHVEQAKSIRKEYQGISRINEVRI